jgi:hypothetical protein
MGKVGIRTCTHDPLTAAPRCGVCFEALEAIKKAATEYCDFVDARRRSEDPLKPYNVLRAALDGMSLEDWEAVRYNADGTGKKIPEDWHGRR